MPSFLVLQQELGDRLGLDQTVASNETKLQRWLNLAQDNITARHDWHFLEERDIIQTVADKTAGTVSLTSASATVTGTSTSFASGDVGKFIQFENLEDWYEVTGYTSATSITITPAYGGTTDTSNTYILRQIYYTFDNDVNRILSIKQYNTPIKLTQIAASTLDMAQPNIETTGAPRAYALFRLTPFIDINTTLSKQYSKRRQIQFFPSPNDTYNIECRYIKFLADMTDNFEISQIPQQWHEAMLCYAEMLGAKYLNDPKETQLRKQYEDWIRTMKEEESAHGDFFPVLGSSDAKYSRFLPFPTTFEQPE